MNRPLLDSREETTSSRAYDYDVTLSWNGEGTEQPCVDHLYTALVRSGLRTFRDDDIRRRERISKFYIQEVRKKSMISVIVLSKDFISSIALLHELEMIIECSRRSEYLVVLVFSDVDPSEIIRVAAFAEQQIKKERDGSTEGFPASYGETYGKQIRREKIKSDMLKGMAVLQEASNLMGFILPNEPDSHGSIIIQRFVDFIQDGLKGNKISLWGDKVCQLRDSGISKLPENMNFPVLSMLFLQDNNDLLGIPPSFFQFMPALQVLDMSRTSIKYLPPSISNLVELRKLLLRDCKLLMELPPEIRELKNLVVFDLSGTELIYMPKEIEMLHKLVCLRMSLCACADEYVSEMKEITEIIPTKTLSKLSNLKELCIFVDPDGEWWDTVVESIIQDLVSLEKMETVKLYFPTVELLQKFMQLPMGVKCQSLSNFRLIVGRYDQGIISHLPHGLQDAFETLEKCLKYVNGVGNINEVAQALKHASALFLDRHWTIDRLSILKLKMDNLRFFLLVECNEMKTVIDGFDFIPKDDNGDKSIIGKPVLGLLQYLSIHYMKNLESICVGPLASGSLYHLQILAFHTCPKLNTIFNIGLLRSLLNLKELIVEDCPKVESLVSVESSYLESGEEFLPSLEKISLLHLTGLVCFSSGLRLAPRLLRMVVYNCPKLCSLFPMELSWKDMKGIKGEIEWWEALCWKCNQNDNLRLVFTPFSRDGLMNQLAEARTSHDTLNTIQKPAENELQVASRLAEGLYGIPKLPDLIVGFNAPLEELKGMLLRKGVPMVVISAPVGSGKTVLATMLCNDHQIRAIFGDIFFVDLSDKHPEFKVIVEKLCHLKGCQPPEFHSEEDALNRLENLLREIGTHPVLLVLDNVGLGWQSHIQKLMFQIAGYKILVTSRLAFEKRDSVYKLYNLNDEDAMTLFCHSAFPEAWSPDIIPDNLVHKMVRVCKRTPLALVTVGRSLFLQSEVGWRNVLNFFYKVRFKTPEIELLPTCMEVFSEYSLCKERYLDLGSFPQEYPASAVIDVWMELYKLQHRWFNYGPLVQLSSRKLIRLRPTSKSADGDDRERYDVEHCEVFQHRLTRELAIHLSSQEPIEQRRRLIVDIRRKNLPKWWIAQKHQPLHARILSITTGDRFSSRWFDLQLPEVEVVILNFRSRNYTLPLFMERMDKLRALIITYCGYLLAELNNFELLGRLSNLKLIRLQNILTPSLGRILVQMWNLRKISLCRCDMEAAFQNFTSEPYNLCPNLGEISIDDCTNFLELPDGLCNLVCLKKLSIFHCCQLLELPKGLGRLRNLDSLKLRACTSLEGLPESIGDLRKLEVLDISGCVSITELPSRIGELHSLIKLNIGDCMGLRGLPRSFLHLVQLKEVVCSEKMYPIFKSTESLLPSLKIKVV